MTKKFILINPYWKDLRCVEKVLSEKPATWQKYEDKAGGKAKILEMEIREYKEAKGKVEDGELSVKEHYKALKHVAAAALEQMKAIREENDGRI